MHIKFSSENLQGRDQLGELDVDVTEFKWLTIQRSDGSCRHSNGPKG
jgi:hypothetical protein